MILTVHAGGNLAGAGVYVNGKRLKFKKEKTAGGTAPQYVAGAETDGAVALSVIKRSPLSFKHWFGKAFLLWLFGIFGLFTPRYKKRYKTLCYNLNAEISSDAEIFLRIVAQNGRTYVNATQQFAPAPPVSVGADFAYEEEGNVWTDDPVAKKHRKYYHIFNAVFWILLILGGAAVAALLLLN